FAPWQGGKLRSRGRALPEVCQRFTVAVELQNVRKLFSFHSEFSQAESKKGRQRAEVPSSGPVPSIGHSRGVGRSRQVRFVRCRGQGGLQARQARYPGW